MVMDNITHILNNFLACSAYDHVIFCWVLHEQEILDTLLSRLDCRNAEVHLYSLILDEKSLEERLKKDIRQGLRQKDCGEFASKAKPHGGGKPPPYGLAGICGLRFSAGL